QAHSITGELQLHAGHAAPNMLLPTGHKTQNQLVQNACAKCKRIWGSSSNHTDRQYWAVDSITASFTPCSCNQIRSWCNWSGMVANRRRVGFSCGAVPSTITTISTFLCTSIPAIFIASSWRGSGRTHAKKLHTVTCYHLSYTPGWRDTD